MPSLAELTDQYPQIDTSLPVQQPYAGANLGPLQPPTSAPIGNTSAIVEPTTVDTVQAYDPNASVGIGSHIVNKLLGVNGEDRYQTWPEKVVREALATPHDIATGEIPQYSVDPNTGDVHTSPQMIAGAQAVSALAGSGGLGGIGEEAGAALGAGPFLRPALKVGDKIYKAPIKDAGNPLGFGAEHSDALPAHLADDFYKKAMNGDDINHYNFGFVNHKGQFLDRSKALDYGINEGLVDPQNGKYGMLTSTMLADSTKPGMALESMAKTEPFYSALEHNINAISQAKMTGNQWLGTLSNKPGVKPEEMDWTGVKDFLKDKGDQPVTKAELQEHLANNKVELKEVDKGTGELKKAAEDLQAAVGNNKVNVANHRDKLYADEIEQGLWSGDITPKDLPTNLQPHAEKMLSLRHQQESPTKYHSYQLPGGSNYREKLLTLPGKSKLTPKQEEMVKLYKQEYGDDWKSYLSPSEKSELDLANADKSNYRSSHWDEPNILAHVRMNDRMIDGKKSLGINEAQSDWHQQGRKIGYAPTEAEKTAASDKIKEIRQQQQDLLKSRITKTPDSKYAVKMDTGETVKFNDQQSATQVAMMPTGEVRPKWIELDEKAAELGRIASNVERQVPNAPFKKTWHELVLKRMIREAAEKGYDNLHFPGSPETVAKVEGWSDFKTKTVDGKPRYFTGDQDVTPIVDRYLVDFPRFLNKIGKEHGAKVSSLEIPGKLSNKMGEPPEIIKLNHMDIPESLKNTAMHKGFPLFSNKYMFVPVQGDPFADKK